MKKILLTTLLAGACVGSAFAQGSVNFSAISPRFAKYTTDGTTLTSVAAGTANQLGTTYGTINVAVYSATIGTAAPFGTGVSSLSLLPSAWNAPQNLVTKVAAAGTIAGTVVTLGNVPASSTTEVMVLAWSGTYADWNSAYTAAESGAKVLLGWGGSLLSGGAFEYSTGTGNPFATPPTTAVGLPTGVTGFNGLVLQPVPEPTSFALLGLGAASLLIFRRRK